MKKNLYLFAFFLVFFSCTNREVSPGAGTETIEKFSSKKENGRWTTNSAMAEQLRAMDATLENFTLLNKKKYENLKAYQQFASFFMDHVNLLRSVPLDDGEARNSLYAKLDSLEAQSKIMLGSDMNASSTALKVTNSVFSQIRSAFNFDF